MIHKIKVKKIIIDDKVAESANLIAEYIGKTNTILEEHDRPLVSISGGSDSDIMLDIVMKSDHASKCVFCFYDTGLEWTATKRHLSYLEDRYGIKIHHRRPKKPIPVSTKENGLPFGSKYTAEYMGRLQSHGFDFVASYGKTFDELYEEYPNCKSALKWYCARERFGTQHSITSMPYLKEFLRDNPPTQKYSAKCCEDVKKRVSVHAAKEFDCDLMIVGIRKAEGGARTAIKSCQYNSHGYDTFAPLFWFKNDDKELYEKLFGIVHSDCYEKYGLKRTGCAACPFAIGNFENELEVMNRHEPKMYIAANNVFGTAYDYTRQYKEYRARMKENGKRMKKNAG